MAQHAKSNSWTSRVSCSAGSILRGRSDDTPARNALVPMPIFVLGFKSTGAALPGLPALFYPRDWCRGSDASTERSRQRHRAMPSPRRRGCRERPEPPRQGDSIDLIIDKLPHHRLVKPVPVSISPLGDRVFIASAPDLEYHRDRKFAERCTAVAEAASGNVVRQLAQGRIGQQQGTGAATAAAARLHTGLNRKGGPEPRIRR